MYRIIALLAVLALPAHAAQVYDSPANNGDPGGVAGVPTDGTPTLLNLFIDAGPNESSSVDKCTGNGSGDELCGWQIRLSASGGMSIDGFTPASGVVANVTAARLDANGLSAIDPSAGPQAIGTVTVSALGEGELALDAGLAVGSTLIVAPIQPALLASTAIDADGDGIPDIADNCTLRANPDQRDTNGDGYGNVCDADLNNDGITNPVDLGLFRSVFFTADEDADFNGDGVVNPVDLGVLKLLFFMPPGPSGVAP